MKYLITESKMNGLIERYILKKYSKVRDVSFATKKRMLGSNNNEIIDVTLIWVTFDNSDNKMTQSDMVELKQKIMMEVDQVFGLDWQEYGSGWDFMFRQLALVNLTATLENT
jgi:hypothetical protein